MVSNHTAERLVSQIVARMDIYHSAGMIAVIGKQILSKQPPWLNKVADLFYRQKPPLGFWHRVFAMRGLESLSKITTNNFHDKYPDTHKSRVWRACREGIAWS